MTAAIAPQAQAIPFRFSLVVASGPEAGRAFAVVPPLAKIGRERGNHILLADPKVSRHHATIEFHPDQIVIKEITQRQNLLVNGVQSSSAPLKNGDQIRIGQTDLIFRVEVNPAALSLVQPAAPAPAPAPSAPRSSHQSSGRLRFYIIVAAVFGLIFWLLSTDTKKKEEDRIRSSEDVQESIRSSEERQLLLSQKREFTSEDERVRYEEAQRHYFQGFRDYQRGNYARAMRSFETARAIDPNHEMAKRYSQLAIRRRDELINQSILEGRAYKDRNMFSRCVGSLDKALKVAGEGTDQDLKLREAKVLRNECAAMLSRGP